MSRFLTRRVVLPTAYLLRGETPYLIRRDLERSQWFSPDSLRELQLRKLRRILQAAWKQPFHRERIEAAGLAPGRIESLADLGRLPPMEKQDLRRAVGGIHLPARLLRPYSRRQTAGTSGIPLTVYADGNTGAHVHAARLRSQGWYGIHPGDREARCWGRPLPAGQGTSVLRNQMLNRLLIHSTDMDPGRRASTLQRLAQWGPDYIYGYSTLISSVVDAAVDAGMVAGIAAPMTGLKAVICTAEMILAAERRRLASILGCPVIGEYGCSETDIISFECPAGGRHILAENVLLEVEPGSGADDSTGEALVTDLNNVMTPLLRYRLGDVITLGAGVCACGRGLPLLEAVQGRHQGQYIHTPDGRRVHSVVFAYLVEKLLDDGADIRRFRIVQQEPDLVRVLIVTGNEAGAAERERMENELIAGSAGELGPAMVCRVEFPADIPRAVDGKHSYFVPLGDGDDQQPEPDGGRP